MKKVSIIIIVIAFIFIVISQSMVLHDIKTCLTNKMFSLSFIGLGIAAIKLLWSSFFVTPGGADKILDS